MSTSKETPLENEQQSVENENTVKNEVTDNTAEEKNTADPVKELEDKNRELNDKFLRLYSEFDNFKRRNAKERLELIKTAGEDVLKSLLPVLDDFERAIKAAETDEHSEALKKGVDLIYNKLLNVCKMQGLVAMESSIGQPFDADIHEAITQIPAPTEKEKGKVIDEIERGYKLHEKVIRYAKVVVGA